MEKESELPSNESQVNEDPLTKYLQAPWAEELLKSTENLLRSVERRRRNLYFIASAGAIAWLIWPDGPKEKLFYMSFFLLFCGVRFFTLNQERREAKEDVRRHRDLLTSAKERDEQLKPAWEEVMRKNAILREFAQELILGIGAFREKVQKDLSVEDTRLALVAEIERKQIGYDERVLAVFGNLPPSGDHFQDALKSTLGLTRFGYPVDSR